MSTRPQPGEATPPPYRYGLVLGPKTLALLGARERQVVNCMLEGLVNREIAKRLCIQHSTVKWHAHNIFTKLGCSGRIALMSRAFAARGLSDKDVASLLSVVRANGKHLTPRQEEVLRCLMFSPKNIHQIGQQLGIFPRTIRTHSFVVMKKLDINRREQLYRLVVDRERGAP